MSRKKIDVRRVSGLSAAATQKRYMRACISFRATGLRPSDYYCMKDIQYSNSFVIDEMLILYITFATFARPIGISPRLKACDWSSQFMATLPAMPSMMNLKSNYILEFGMLHEETVKLYVKQ